MNNIFCLDVVIVAEPPVGHAEARSVRRQRVADVEKRIESKGDGDRGTRSDDCALVM